MARIIMQINRRNLLPELTPEIAAICEREVRAAALAFETEVHRTMSSDPKTGREYAYLRHSTRVSKRTGRVSKRTKRVVHRASAPGESPAVQTGLLSNSIRAYSGSQRFTWFVGTPVRYAARLEFGSGWFRSGRLKARPYMRPTAKKIAPRFSARLRKAIMGAMRQGL